MILIIFKDILINQLIIVFSSYIYTYNIIDLRNSVRTIYRTNVHIPMCNSLYELLIIIINYYYYY